MKYCTFIILYLVAVGACYAGAFEEGGAAYRAGDYELAAKKFMEVADKNDHRAMYALGSMYAAGKGVPATAEPMPAINWALCTRKDWG